MFDFLRFSNSSNEGIRNSIAFRFAFSFVLLIAYVVSLYGFGILQMFVQLSLSETILGVDPATGKPVPIDVIYGNAEAWKILIHFILFLALTTIFAIANTLLTKTVNHSSMPNAFPEDGH